MKDIEYKGKKIAFSESDLKFFVWTSPNKRFSSVASAKKAIDKAAPPEQFKKFQVVVLGENGKPETVTIVKSEFIKALRRYDDDRIAFSSENITFSKWEAFYDVQDLEELTLLSKEQTRIEKQIEELQEMSVKIDSQRKEMEIHINGRSNYVGNVEPTREDL